MRVVVGGASGMIGTELTSQLRETGDEVVRLVRRTPAAADEAAWDPASGELDETVLLGADAIVNLSGASLSRLPWTRRYRREIRDSRLAATSTLVAALHRLSTRGERLPALISGSAVGYYGSRPGERLDETSTVGAGFLADVVRDWEEEALKAPAGTRVVLARTGVVLGPGGALAPLRLLTRLGVAGPLGSGRQHWPWICLRDEAAAIRHLIRSELHGPVNLVGPDPATMAEIGRSLARSLRRPFWLPAPAFALTALLGDAARELLLADQHVVPRALQDSGFVFRHPRLADAL